MGAIVAGFQTGAAVGVTLAMVEVFSKMITGTGWVSTAVQTVLKAGGQ